MFKLIVFDLDKTLADLGKGMSARNTAKLRRLEKSGARLRYARESRRIIFAALCGKRD